MTSKGSVQHLPRPDGNFVAYVRTAGTPPTVVFLGGFRSDMTGTKATALEAWAQKRGQAYLRFDYLGHGQSSGCFEDGTIGRWLDDSLAAIDGLTDGRLVLVGSSMGGWLSLLAARARAERMAGLVLIAAAPDFTERMLLEGLSPEDRATLERDGRLERPSQYSPEPSVFTWKLIEEGRRHLLLDKPLALPCPVRLLHGQSDPDVPWEYSLQIARHLNAPEVVTTLVKGGDHRLSTSADIARLIATVEELVP
ncbi:alpha/beta hydrolase [Enhydrobacter sp.]|jgi:pimeloyl-ACP methyl ester carboxylesterase|uniref:alpha/beta hydrolase n=1 Tax=Enhydrobacter sp. TaxID=1894999 RepID=UPI00260419B4|nr:alpha/beta hydrolase [Enhydrobacter sp.]WIM11968.1 MAG: 2-hydroxymuconic semialdehyde hydrolase [Enhydrobacter sp.]